MSITKQVNKNGVIAVYDTYSYWDPELKKNRTRRRYLGTMKGKKFIPTSNQKGRKRKDASLPVKISGKESLEAQVLLLQAEVERYKALLAQIRALIDPSLIEAEEENDQNECQNAADCSHEAG